MTCLEQIESQIEKVENWQTLPKAPLVSVYLTTYNHSRYIQQALDGILMQQTKFPMELIVCEDKSTDDTRAIVCSYQKKHPEIIRLWLATSNLYSQGLLPGIGGRSACRGRYIAALEGDDYWTDPLKLEKQVNFLEMHPEYVLATHDIHTIDENGNLLSKTFIPDFYKRDFSSKDLRCGWAGPKTQAMLFRNVIHEHPQEFAKTTLADVFLSSLLGQYGASKYMTDIEPTMYRLHSGATFSTLIESDMFDLQAYSFFWMYKYYKRIGMPYEARLFKLKSLEKQLRNLSFADWCRLFLVRFLKFNVKNQLG